MKKASAMKNQRNMQSAKKGTFARLLKYLFKYYGWQIIIMCITLLMVSAGMLVGNVYMQKLIDERGFRPACQNGRDDGFVFRIGRYRLCRKQPA